MRAQLLILVDLLAQNKRFISMGKPILAALGLSFLIPATASASCYIDGSSGRLSNYCALDKIQGARVNVRTAQLIDYKLKLEGSTRGLGFPARVKPNSTSKSLYPILSYSDNINGGNSPEPLVIGSLTFDGDEALYRKEGVVAGFGAGVSGRYIHAEGKYLTYGVNASYAHSPKYGLGIATTSANVSSINHIKNWWFLDAHINTSRVRKDITDETNSNISLVSSKVYASAENTYSEASFGVNRYFDESYNQNQLLLGYKTIHANGVYSALNFTFGESVENQLATKFALSGQLTTQFAKKPLKLSASYSQADGGMLLGIARDETTVAVSASYPVWKNLTASVGYRRTDSSIDYFDVSTPTFGVQFNAIQF
jgi:hypothetical protein